MADPTYPIQTGTYTFESPTGQHRTVRVGRLRPADAKFMPGRRLVELLTGADNTHDFTSFGVVGEHNDVVHVWRQHRSDPTDPASRPTLHEALADMLRQASGLPHRLRDWTALGYVTHDERACVRCGRALTTPQSVKDGIGPVCATKVAT